MTKQNHENKEQSPAQEIWILVEEYRAYKKPQAHTYLVNIPVTNVGDLHAGTLKLQLYAPPFTGSIGRDDYSEVAPASNSPDTVSCAVIIEIS